MKEDARCIRLNHGRLAQLDLNLLIALDAIYCEQSVTEAAKRLAIRQSSMSRQLARLRDIFQDDLFVRTPAGMAPTPRGAILAKQAKEVLSQVQHGLLSQTAFDPASSTRIFRLGISSYLEDALLPRLSELHQDEAPSIRLQINALDRCSAGHLLDEGNIDIAVGATSEGGQLHKRKVLFNDRYICLYNPKFFKNETVISQETYLAYPHVAIDLKESACRLVDDALDRLSQRRKIMLSTPNVHAIPGIVARSPSFATVPRSFGISAAKLFGLCLAPVPFEVEAFQVSLVWHASSDQDKGMSWLRSTLARVMAASRDDLEESNTMVRSRTAASLAIRSDRIACEVPGYSEPKCKQSR